MIDLIIKMIDLCSDIISVHKFDIEYNTLEIYLIMDSSGLLVTLLITLL